MPEPNEHGQSRIGKYLIEDLIGQGGMGQVYRGYDPVLERRVALKTLSSDAAPHWRSSLAERFKREARSAASLSHPNIVTVYDFGDVDNQLFLVMELLDGESLADALLARRFSQMGQKLRLLEEIALGVAHAHSQGIVHRDLKPSNIQISTTGTVKVLDFGLARTGGSQLTTVGTLLGTPRYMAPEVIRGFDADMPSDVFSLGTIYYEILSNQPCFPATSVHATLFQVLEREPAPVTTFDPSIPPPYDQLVHKALEKDPAGRFVDAGELHKALLAARERTVGDPSEDPTQRFPLPTPPSRLRAVSQSQVSSAPGPLSTSTDPADGATQAMVQFRGEEGPNQNIFIRLPSSKTLLELSLASNIPHLHECGGRGRCSTCRIRVTENAAGLSPRSSIEQRLANSQGWGDDIRLACQARVLGNVTVKRLIRTADDLGVLHCEMQQTPAREAPVALLACQLQDLSQLRHRSEAYDVMHILNRFYLQVGDPILECGGEIERYVDEGLVAHFGLAGGDPKTKCMAAVRAAVRISARMEELRRYLRSHFDLDPKIGIGLHFGRTIVGEIGHPSRRETVAIGALPSMVSRLARAATTGRVEAGLTTAMSEVFFDLVEQDVIVGDTFHAPWSGGDDALCYELVDLARPDAARQVQISFEQVARHADKLAVLFYELLFQLDPSLEELFAETDMSIQGDKLVGVLATAIRALDDLEGIRPTLEALGRRHFGYGAQIPHFDAVEQALLEAVGRILGPSFTTDLRLAWSAVFNQLAGIMIEAMEQESAGN